MDTFNPTDQDVVDSLCEFLRFKTLSLEGHKTGQNVACVAFLERSLQRIGLLTEILPGPQTGCKSGEKPVLIGKWPGLNEALPAVLLNSHYDVVPVMTEKWTKPAWDGVILTEDGEERIYGRGSQDMKCVGIQYIAAIARLKATGFQPLRNIYLSFVPDEEVGGSGMSSLTRSDIWKKMKVGVALDEGLANPSNDSFTVFYGERAAWWVVVEAKGPTGHGSRFIEGMATNALTAFQQAAWRYRKSQKERLGLTNFGCKHCEAVKLGDVMTINLTMLKSGVSPDGGSSYNLNVIPTEASAGFDIRIPVTLPMEEVIAMLDGWCREAEEEVQAEPGSVTWKFPSWSASPFQEHYVSTADESNPWWAAFQSGITATSALGGNVNTVKEIFPAGSDARFHRALGIPAFGFSPMRGCPILLHEHDEYIPRKVLLEGVQVYESLISTLASFEHFENTSNL